MLWWPTLWAALLGHWVSHCYQLDSEDKATIVELHNHFRSHVLPTATNMRKMSWMESLETTAAEYVTKCVWDHNPNRGDIGENLFVGTGPFNLTKAVTSWYLEHQDYTYHNNSCKEDNLCGHYTQVVWADTYFVGCASHLCEEVEGLPFTMATMLVCNYSPQGNYEGEWPYEEGESCSKCPGEAPLCENHLCVAETPEASETPHVSEGTTKSPQPGPDTPTPSYSGPDTEHTTMGTDQTITTSEGEQPLSDTSPPPDSEEEEDDQMNEGGKATFSSILLAATALLLFL
ncbi:peptidase inhibitor 16-like [Megalops cyprinoides]|uniref:peptidase inhibitor 16-like n=1 Tax=Megalops cyprinoides TaxID=118141 RepID=UPI001863AE73|nr:peptidase inhibitor 16-like [Megalops cyprinoides]